MQFSTGTDNINCCVHCLCTQSVTIHAVYLICVYIIEYPKLRLLILAHSEVSKLVNLKMNNFKFKFYGYLILRVKNLLNQY